MFHMALHVAVGLVTAQHDFHLVQLMSYLSVSSCTNRRLAEDWRVRPGQVLTQSIPQEGRILHDDRSDSEIQGTSYQYSVLHGPSSTASPRNQPT